MSSAWLEFDPPALPTGSPKFRTLFFLHVAALLVERERGGGGVGIPDTIFFTSLLVPSPTDGRYKLDALKISSGKSWFI